VTIGSIGDRAIYDPGPFVVAFATREKTRGWLRQRLPRRRMRLAFARGVEEMSSYFRRGVVDAAIVDIGAGGMECERAIGLAREFPSAGFLGLAAYRAADGSMIARCAAVDFADVLAEGVDDALLPSAIAAHGYSSRFAWNHREPPEELGMDGPLRTAAWYRIVAQAGRVVRTTDLAAALGMSREHLSRSFARGGAPNLKRVVDLVRLLSAAELSKNPGYDVGDVARVLGFASGSHLSATAQRLLGVQASSLASLRAIDLIGRFARGRGRSRV
jgi:AraC-like DNA-binding protein